MQMPENIQRHFAHCALGDFDKHNVAQLGKQRRGQSQQTVGNQQQNDSI